MGDIRENLTLVLSIAAIIGIIFNIYKSYHGPQEQSEKQQIINKAELDSKTQLIDQKLQWEKEATERRFRDVAQQQTEAMTLAQNHIHTVDTKVDALIKEVGNLKLATKEVSTIINERLPKNI